MTDHDIGALYAIYLVGATLAADALILIVGWLMWRRK